MPRGNGTGPKNGMGPMTGRCAGYCAGNSIPGYMNNGGGRGFFGFGRGLGLGLGGGRGWRNIFRATGLTGRQRADVAAPQQDLNALKQQAENLQNSLDEINRRMDELQK